jgi:septum formation protein
VRLILASRSPRRAALLRAAGFAFDVDPVDIDERPLDGEPPRNYVTRLALEKARRVACRNPGSLVLGADTTVLVGRRLLGKPADSADAAAMLKLLSGRTHRVLTGVALCLDSSSWTAVEVTWVRFLPLTDDEIAWYVGTGEPDGKAGAYAIQGLGSRFVDRIEGSYTNVVGLPVTTVYRRLVEIGWPGLLDRQS